MAEAKKNANLLEEYHSLYELQRHRLEAQIAALTAEKELWSGAAYNLALKVGNMEEVVDLFVALTDEKELWSGASYNLSLKI